MERKWATQTLFLRERLARGRGWEARFAVEKLIYVEQQPELIQNGANKP
jgi:hypothetical protein